PNSTAGHAKLSASRRPPKPSTSYSQTRPIHRLLHRPLETIAAFSSTSSRSTREGVPAAASVADEVEQARVVGCEALDLFAAVAAQQRDGDGPMLLTDHLPDGACVLPTLKFCHPVDGHGPTIPSHEWSSKPSGCTRLRRPRFRRWPGCWPRPITGCLRCVSRATAAPYETWSDRAKEAKAPHFGPVGLAGDDRRRRGMSPVLPRELYERQRIPSLRGTPPIRMTSASMRPSRT
ncbi:MAG: hypothetical protein QOD39_5273, partial [Mycobacterium sp.]|nr:hypothetical protein [Mycobacterium sp.]